MTRTVIRYKAKPEAAERNADLIRNVFRELTAANPGNVRYAVLQSDDDTFIHLVSYETEGDNKSLTTLPAFVTFQEGGAECRATKPEFSDMKVVGNYRVFAETQ